MTKDMAVAMAMSALSSTLSEESRPIGRPESTKDSGRRELRAKLGTITSCSASVFGTVIRLRWFKGISHTVSRANHFRTELVAQGLDM